MDPGIPDLGPCKRVTIGGSKTAKGYIMQNQKLAHRTAYEQAYGPIPDGYQIDHLCGNKWCIEPYHLEAVTVKENRRRAELIEDYLPHIRRRKHIE